MKLLSVSPCRPAVSALMQQFCLAASVRPECFCVLLQAADDSCDAWIWVFLCFHIGSCLSDLQHVMFSFTVLPLLFQMKSCPLWAVVYLSVGVAEVHSVSLLPKKCIMQMPSVLH